MRCPICKQDNDKVIETRLSEDGFFIRRRRACACGKRFTTYERVEPTHVRVVKRDGHRVSFNREKLRRGLEKACWKRPIGDEQIAALMTKVERDIDSVFENEVPSSYIGERVMQYLGEIDQVALIRFASVYQHFEDASDFTAKVSEVINNPDIDLQSSVHSIELQELRLKNGKTRKKTSH